MHKLIEIPKAVIDELLNDVVQFWSAKFYLWRVRKSIKLGKLYAKSGNKRVYILPDHKNRPQPYFKENIKENIKIGYFQERILKGTWLLENAIEIIEYNGKTLLNKPEYTGKLIIDEKLK